MDDRFRVSDADRERAAALLRDHFAAGRLSAAELDQRLAASLAAKTAGDLRRNLADLPETAPALWHAGFGSPQAAALERGYRRLLACYPVWYRRVHEEEMLAVLMTGAPPEKRRPQIAEAADLLWGALRIRCQPARGAEPAWRDALAVMTVILPLILTVIFAVWWTRILLSIPGPAQGFPWSLFKATAAPLGMGILVPLALRRRRLAALASAGLLITLVTFQYGYTAGVLILIGESPVILALGLQTVALAASPGPRRGLQILTWKHAALVLIATLLVATAASPLGAAARLVVIGVIAAGMVLASSAGRWVLVWLAIPASPPLLARAPFQSNDAAMIVASYLPFAALIVLAALAALAARRASSRSATPPGRPGASP
jgi:hypothetical protein